jgi:hypothetical protein
VLTAIVRPPEWHGEQKPVILFSELRLTYCGDASEYGWQTCSSEAFLFFPPSCITRAEISHK